MSDKIYKGEEARKLIAEGVKEFFETIKVAYGPVSGNVGILKQLRPLRVTHDGATIAKNIELKGPLRAGAETIQNAAIKMERELGDGTTTVMVLASSIVAEVQDNLSLGDSPIKIRDRLQEEAKLVVSKLPAFTKKEEVTLDVLKQIGAISASDDALGAKVAEIVYQVGDKGYVSVEEGLGTEVEGEVVRGYTIDNGLASNYMIQDVSSMTTTLVNPKVLIANQKITNYELLITALQAVKGGPLLIIADDMSDGVMGALIKTNEKELTNVAFVKSPRFGKKRTEFLKDIAAVVGTEVIDGKSVGFDTALGVADRIVCTTEKTVIMGGAGDVTERKSVIDGQIKLADDDFEIQEAEQRRAAIEGKTAVIRVGGMSQDEVNEIKDRIDDAVYACQAALRSNVVAGGGTTLIDLAEELPNTSILKRVLKVPFETLLDNIGLKASDFEAGKGMGVNLRTGEFVDMFKEGIIEPAETVEKAIQYAVSIAGTAITMKVLIVEEEDEDE